MPPHDPNPLSSSPGAAAALRTLMEGTARSTGMAFFHALVKALTEALNVRCAFVSAREGATGARARMLAVLDREGIIETGAYDFAGTACARVLGGAEMHCAEGIASRIENPGPARQWGLESYYGTPLTNSRGEPIGALCVTDRRRVDLCDSMRALLRLAAARAGAELERMLVEERLERTIAELRAASEAAHAASRAKSDFLANMSHEIRTPMTAILGYASLLEDPALPDPDRRDAAQTIRRNGEHLLAILDDILDLSKIEAGRMTLERVPVCPLRLLEEAESVLRIRAAAKGVALHTRWNGDPPRPIASDPTRLRQILLNLAGNAVKFTDRGSVTIVGSLEPAPGADARALRFDVIDTGVGIPPEQQPRLFNAFTQADASVTRRFGGAGLGLSISRRLAQMLGGDITVSSREGEGSTFTVRVRAVEAQAAPAGPCSSCAVEAPQPALSARTLDGLRVLLVEDGPDNQRLLQHLLRQGGASVDLAADGLQALELALPARPDGPYDLIVMDMQMPRMDGYAATRALRQAGFAAPILALTAHAMVGSRERCAEAGCDEFLTKPVERTRLLGACADLARSARSRRDPRAAA